MFSNPEKNIKELFLRDGMSVADLGAGSGAYTIAAANIVGDDGLVYAVDVQKDLLLKIKNETTNVGVGNVEILHGNIEKLGGTKIKDSVVDAVIISNVLFQSDDKQGVFNEANRILVKGGKLLVVDWSDSFGGLGPQQSYIFTEKEAKETAQTAGFSYEKDIDAGEHHYGFICTK